MQTATATATTPDDRAGWKVNNWAAAADISRASVYELIAAGKLRSVKFGKCRIILTSPRELLESLADEAA